MIGKPCSNALVPPVPLKSSISPPPEDWTNTLAVIVGENTSSKYWKDKTPNLRSTSLEPSLDSMINSS